MTIKKKLQRAFEVKELGEDGSFTGYGSVFGELDSYRDIVLPGAFKKTIEKHQQKGRAVKMLWQHRTTEPIGVYREIREDDHGLFVRGEINMKVSRGVECYHLMKQGALDGLSIGYSTVESDYDAKKSINYLKELDLWEISPVTFPAGDSARVVDVKSIATMETLSDVEEYLRDTLDFSQKEATAFVARFKQIVIGPSDSGSTTDNAIVSQLDKIKSALESLQIKL